MSPDTFYLMVSIVVYSYIFFIICFYLKDAMMTVINSIKIMFKIK
jgi:hypothetical protein